MQLLNREVISLKGSVNAAVIKIENRSVKMKLPNNKVVDILPEVFEEINKWLQIDDSLSESGGFIVGYQHKGTNNISLECVSHPYPLDTRNRVRFNIKDPKHKLFLLRASARKSYYMGVWHTHPQRIPEPSQIDWNDWKETLDMDQTACEYVFFLIAGSEGARIWVGDLKTKAIKEIFECEKERDLYKKNKL